MEKKFLQVKNLEVFMSIAGEGNPFLILHGWGKGHFSWVETQKKLSKHFQVILLDLPGFGKSEVPPRGWSIQDYVQFVLAFTEKIEINDFHLLGHSFGGSIAINLAVQSSEKVKKLILVDSAGRRSKKSFSKKILTPTASFFKIFSFLPGYKLFRKFFYRFILGSTDYPQAVGTMKKTFKKVIEEDLSCLWEKIDSQTLIIWGKKDKITPLEDAYLMKKKIKNSELKVFDYEHSPQKEAPDILVKAILDFIL